MVLIKTNGNISNIKGSIGENIFSSNKGKCYMRSKGKTHSNPQSANQSKQRNRVSEVSKYWNDTLTQAQRDTWIAYAGQHESGFNAFLRNNTNYYQYGAQAGGAPILGNAVQLTKASLNYGIIQGGYDVISADNTYTIAFWVYLNSMTDWQLIYCNNALADYVAISTAGNIRWLIQPQGNIWDTITNPITQGTWHRVVIVHESDSSGKIYVDANDVTPAGCNQGQAPTYNNTPMVIGRYGSNNQYMLDGKLDEFVIFGTAWTQGDVTTDYAGTGVYYTPSSPNIVLGFHFDETAGVIADDFTATSKDCTFSGCAWVPGRVMKPGTALYFISTAPLGITPPDAPKNFTATYNAGPKTITVTWTPGHVPGSRIGIWIKSVDEVIHKQLVANEDITTGTKTISQAKSKGGITLPLSAIKSIVSIHAQACDNYGQLSPSIISLKNVAVN